MKLTKRIFLIFFLFATGVFTTYCSSSLNENLDGNIYMTQIDMHAKDLQGNKIEPLYIQPFTFNYDFSKQKGNISFKVTRDLTFYTASIHFPAEVKDETFKVFHLKGKEKIEINKTINNEGISPYVDFSDHDKLILEKGDGLLIEFESELIPKARFNFIIGRDLVLYRDGSAGAEVGNINLIVGDKYQCITPCLYGLYNLEERFNSFDGNLKLEWRSTTSNQNHLLSNKKYS